MEFFYRIVEEHLASRSRCSEAVLGFIIFIRVCQLFVKPHNACGDGDPSGTHIDIER
jgi:hypothetical protein